MAGVGAPAYVHLLRARDRIDREFMADLDVASLAATALSSEAHFARSFKRAFGETPGQYLTRRRMERAADLLRETQLTVTEVCLSVGLGSLGSFCTAFREHFGATPSEYRERWAVAPPASMPACFTLMWTRPVDRAVSEKPERASRG